MVITPILYKWFVVALSNFFNLAAANNVLNFIDYLVAMTPMKNTGFMFTSGGVLFVASFGEVY